MLDNINYSKNVLARIIGEILDSGSQIIYHDEIEEHCTRSYSEVIRGGSDRRSIKDNMQRALNQFVNDGHLKRGDNNDGYKCHYKTSEKFFEAIKGSLDKPIDCDDFSENYCNNPNIYRLDLKDYKSTNDDLDDDDDDDDDDLDFGGAIKFQKIRDEPISSKLDKNVDDDEDDGDMDELDKLLKELSDEMEIQSVVESSEDAKTYVARRCETKGEAKQLCNEIQEDINGETAIYFLKAYVYFDSICDDEYIEFRRDNA